MNKKKSASAFTIARACLVQSKLLNMRRILHRFRPKSDSDGGNCDKKAKDTASNSPIKRPHQGNSTMSGNSVKSVEIMEVKDDMMIPGNNGFSDPTKLKEQITLVPLNVYSSESDDSDMDHNGIPDIDPDINDYTKARAVVPSAKTAHLSVDDDTLTETQRKLLRRDTLNRMLKNRPRVDELVQRNIIFNQSEEERHTAQQKIEINLQRRLSCRPTVDELRQKNILRDSDTDRKTEKLKSDLSNKLARRPTMKELATRNILQFIDLVEVLDVELVDRQADKPWTRLTAEDKARIRQELNEYKSTEMEVHEESRHRTRFHRP
ncbi:hypothetical protein ACHWQZ_G017354 [Mnemiopsis leidyi]